MELFNSKTGYAIDYVRELVEEIRSRNALEITAPTGSGKTTMLSGCIGRKKMFKGLIDYFNNPCIIVPFNATDYLYEGPGMNIVASFNNNKVKKSGTNVMVIDQFNKHIREFLMNPPEVIFVDESHELYTCQEYRDSAIECLGNLKNLMSMGVKVVLITATPAGEVLYFNADVIQIEMNDRRLVKFEFIKTKDTFDCMVRDMSYAHKYDRVAIFSDRDCWMLYEHGISKDLDITVCHTKRRENVLHLVETEMLDHKVTTLTNIAYNGLNIKNQGEKILVCIRYTYNETTINDILQIVGRFRKVDELDVKVYFDNKYDGRSVEDFLRDCNDAKILDDHGADEFITPYYERIAVEGTSTAIASVKNYKSNFTLKNIVGTLKSMGYSVNWGRDEAEKTSHSKPMKKIASDLYKESMIADINPSSDDENVSMYLIDWNKRLNRLIANYGDKVKDALKDLFMLKNKNGEINSGNVETHIHNLEKALQLYSMTDEQWDSWVQERESILKEDGISNYLRKRINEVIKRDNMLREKYKDMEFGDVLQDVVDDHWDIIQRFLEGNALGGTNSAKKLYDPINDRYYNSCKEASDSLGVSIQTISKKIKKGILIEQ